MKSEPKTPPRRRARVARWLLRAFLGLFALLLGLIALAIACINLPPARAFVAEKVTAALSGTFKGKLVIERVGSIGWSGVDRVDARVLDPDGKRVLAVQGLSAHLPWPRLVWNLVVAKPDPNTIELYDVSFDHAEVVLRDDGSGKPTLANTFAPPKPSPGPGKQTNVVIQRISFRHAWVHGRLGSAPALDADLADLAGDLRIDTEATSASVERLQLAARGLPSALDPKGELHARVRLTKQAAERDLFAHFRGEVARVPLTAQARLKGTSVDGVVRGVADPSAVSRLLPGLAPRAPIELFAKATGSLPELAIEARVQSEDGHVDASGQLRVEEPLKATLELRGAALDASAFAAGAPPTELAFELRAKAEKRDELLRGTYDFTLLPSSVSGQPLPGLHTRGSATHEAARTRVEGDLELHEAGAPTSVAYTVDLGRSATLELQLDTMLDDPPRLRALSGVTLSGKLRSEARIDLTHKNLVARLDARLARVRQRENGVASLRFVALAKGALSDPAISADLVAGGLALPGRRFARAHVSTRGTLRMQSVEAALDGSAGERIEVATLVEIEQELALEQVRVSIARESTTMKARAERIAFGKRIRVEQLELEGVGNARASLTMGHKLENLEVSTRDLDVARLAYVLGAAQPRVSAKVDLDAKLERDHDQPSGYLHGNVRELAAGVIERGRVSLALDVERGIASGAIAVELDRAGQARVEIEQLPLLEPPFDEKKLRALTGRIHAQGNLDLAYLGAAFALEQVPIERGQGQVALDVDVRRDEPGAALPDIEARVATKNLELVGKRKSVPSPADPEHARKAAPWVVSKVDVDARLAVQGESGQTDLAFRAFDQLGDLARLDAHTKLGPGLEGALRPDLARLPLQAKLEVPARSLEKLPPMLPLKDTAGRGALDLEVDGTALDPRVRFQGRVAGLRPAGSRTQPLDVDFRGMLEREGGSLSAGAATEGRNVGSVDARWQGDLRELFGPGTARSRVRGQAELALDRLPLAALPGSRERQVKGELSARLALLGLGEDAKLSARIDAGPLRIADSHFEHVGVQANVANGKLEARADLVQKDGSANARLRADVDWGARLTPRLRVPLESQLQAKNFRLGGFATLAPGKINELDGRLNANLVGRFGGDTPMLEGSADLEQGVLQEPTIGQRFQDVSAHVRLAPGEIRVERLSARGTTGRLTASATARLRGLELLAANAHVDIAEREKIALTNQGVAVGDGWGKIDASIERGTDERGTEIKISIPEFHLDLPENERLGVQDLAPADYVRIGVKPTNGAFTTIAMQPLKETPTPQQGPPTVLTVEFGKKVVVRRGAQLEATVSGTTRVVLAEPAQISGQVQVRGGTLDVSGKLFHIERGIVTFDGQTPDNPTIVATARWDSPAGYTVVFEYTGTAKEGQLALSSEPPLTQDQIMSLLMFGNPDGSMGSSSGSPAATAFGVAGGTAVRGLNRVLAKVTKLDIDARVDTSTGSARPEIVLQVTPRLSAHITRALGEPAPGQAPDRTFATLDLKLGGRWSLDTTVGDRGASALDLIWRYRY